ncbi:hypothetical protein LB505_008902 [Fusarium chuoi]|nr:hypothetical protein LB505_008902 [Fusarium chuoi]
MRHSYLASCIRWMLRGDVKEGHEGWVEDLNVDEMIAHIKRGQTTRLDIAASARGGAATGRPGS